MRLSQSLLQRLVSGLALASVMLGVILLAPNAGVALFFAALFLVGAWEWARLTSLTHQAERYAYMAAIAVLMVAGWWVRDTVWALIWLGGAALVWVLIGSVLKGYRQREQAAPRWQFGFRVVGVVLISAAWLAFAKLHQIDALWLLYVLVLVAIADSFAYFTGKLFGRRKLAPHISPGKTREGVIGGLLGVLLFAIVVAYVVGLPFAQSVYFVLLSALVGVISVEGDLFESLLKREAGVKDSGVILPGHGGILDRFDSHIAAAPVFFLGLHWILGVSL
ncbi:MAG: phosphatidate cytidylyltransferase [Thiotrichales bacterium]